MFDTIPLELLHIIFNTLPLGDLGRLSQCCKCSYDKVQNYPIYLEYKRMHKRLIGEDYMQMCFGVFCEEANFAVLRYLHLNYAHQKGYEELCHLKTHDIFISSTEVLDWLYSVTNQDKDEMLSRLLSQYMYQGNPELVEWVRRRTSPDKFKAGCYNLFPDICYYASIKSGIVQYLFSIFPDIHHDVGLDRCLLLACGGELEIVKLLLAEYHQTISNRMLNKLFAAACQYANHAVINWLYDMFPQINIRWKNDTAFKRLCESYNMFGGEGGENELKIINWLCELCPEYISMRNIATDVMDMYNIMCKNT